MKIAAETGLDAGIVESLSEIFADTPEVSEVLVFGSRAKGTFSHGSDIDLGVRGVNVKLDTILDIMTRVKKLGLLYKVEIYDLDAITNKSMLDQIQRVGRVFWRRSQT